MEYNGVTNLKGERHAELVDACPPVGHRYLSEFDFRYNTRAMSDAERGDELLKGAKGKRLTYHQPRQAAHA